MHNNAARTLAQSGLAPTNIADEARPALDAQIVGRLTLLGEATGEDLMGKLATLFLAETEARVVELREALAADDAAAVAGLAHTVRGGSASLGASGLADLCATLEADGAAGDLMSGGALLEAVEAELVRVRAALGSSTPTP